MERRISATPLPQVTSAKSGYDFDHTVNINKATLEAIIRDAVQAQTGQAVKSVRFEISKEYDNYNDYTAVFDGATVTLGGKL